MNRFLSFLVVLCLVVGVFGYWRGWFHAETHNSDGQHSVTVTVDKDKFVQDKDTARQDVGDLAHK